jgi:hypothetical protein
MTTIHADEAYLHASSTEQRPTKFGSARWPTISDTTGGVFRRGNRTFSIDA